MLLSIDPKELETLLSRAVLLHNRLNSPRVFAKIVRAAPELVTILFSGSFCYSCGVLHYVEDFAKDFRVLTDKAELKAGKTREVSSNSFEADYTVRNR